MATLSAGELQKTRTPDRCKIFLDKIIKGEPFITKKGSFVCSALHVDSIVLDNFKGPQAKRNFDYIFNYIKTNKKITINLEGKVENRKQKISISDIEKTSEFGGQAANSGGKINKGILFEKNLEQDLLQWQLKGEMGDYHYKKFLIDFFKEKKGALEKVLGEGVLNKKRPIMKDSKGLYVSQLGRPRNLDVGSTVTDITLKIKNQREPIYLSLKSTNTVTFFNSGIKKFFTRDDIQSGTIQTEMGKELLHLFGLDSVRFCQVFNKYTGIKSTEKQKGVEVKLNSEMKKNLKEFTKTVIGYGFELIHEDNRGVIHWRTMDERTLDRASTIESLHVYYGGISGAGKRIDIIAETPIYTLKFNIRSKDGGILPTHMMCDYTEK